MNRAPEPITPGLSALGPNDKLVIRVIEPGADMRMVDKEGNLILTIYAGAHPVKVNRLGADMVFEWNPAPEPDAQ